MPNIQIHLNPLKITKILLPEFAARVPKAGSAYIYSYVSVGEFVAFTIGWNLILEYVIGTSSVARGLSGYVDSLAGNKMSEFFRSIVQFDVGFLGDYPDLFAFLIVILITGLLAFGVKESSLLNNTFTSVNVLTILLMFITGCMKGEKYFIRLFYRKLIPPLPFQLIRRTGRSRRRTFRRE